MMKRSDSSDKAVDSWWMQVLFFLNKRCSVMVVSAAALAIMVKPCEATVSLPATAVLNAMLGKLLKRLIDQARPAGATDCSKSQGGLI